MIRLAFVAGLVLALTLSAAHAGDRTALGYGRLITNDVFGDGKDRWRTGSYASSRAWGPEWQGTAPAGFGELLEFRFHGEVITPENLLTPQAGDRAYAGALSLGLHTHVQRGATDYALGGDLVIVGPQTKLDDVQDGIHDLLGGVEPSAAVVSAQIGDSIRPSLVFEAGHTLPTGANSRVRPFFETRAGVETLARLGFDWTIGGMGTGELMVRDPVAGQRYRVIEGPWTGYSFTMGADIAYVADSTFLPGGAGGPELKDSRGRVRAGLAWQGGPGLSSFAGVTYLTEEFEGQREGQLIGSVRVRFGF